MRRLFILAVLLLPRLAIAQVPPAAYQIPPADRSTSGPNCPTDPTQCSGYKVANDINALAAGSHPITPARPQGTVTTLPVNVTGFGDLQINTSAPGTVNLFPASGSGGHLRFKNLANNAVTISPSGVQTIDGKSSYVLQAANDEVTLYDSLCVSSTPCWSTSKSATIIASTYQNIPASNSCYTGGTDSGGNTDHNYTLCGNNTNIATTLSFGLTTGQNITHVFYLTQPVSGAIDTWTLVAGGTASLTCPSGTCPNSVINYPAEACTTNSCTDKIIARYVAAQNTYYLEVNSR